MVEVLVLLVVVGVVLWAFNAYVPVAQPFKGIVMFIVVVLACVMLLDAFGFIPSWGWHHVRHYR